MTDTQTEVRPLSAYVPGSRWSGLGYRTVVRINPHDQNPIGVVLDDEDVITYYPLAYAATWTPLDPAPAADALREAAEAVCKAASFPEIKLPPYIWSMIVRLQDALAQPAPVVPEEIANYMAQRFLSWKLPDNFMPDGGVTFDRGDREPGTAWWPTGTNLFGYNQARAMVAHMVEGLPVAALAQPAPASEPVSKAWPSAEGAPVFDLEADAADYQRCKDDARRWEAALAALTGAMAGSAADGTPLYTPEWAAQVSLEAADALVAAMREAGK